jgi:hypothetical protein
MVPDKDGRAARAFRTLVDLAPEFLKEYATRGGLSVNRYWREALTRTGDVRSDRPTVPLVGALVCPDNFQRLLRVIDYGRRSVKVLPHFILSVPPQAPYWGATSLLKDLLTTVRRQLVGETSPATEPDVQSWCAVTGKPAKYVERTFDRLVAIDTVDHAPTVEFLVVPNIAVAVLVHVPIGAVTGLAAPLGFASFDPVVVERVQALILNTTARHVGDGSLRTEIEQGLALQQPPETEDQTG